MPDTPNAERYVAGTLTTEETARFEEAMIERPDLAADVNVRQRIKAGLARLDERQELAPLLANGPATPMRRFAIAAAVALLAVTATWVGLKSWLPGDAAALTSSSAGQRVTETFSLVSTRSQSARQQVRGLPGQGVIQIRLLAPGLAGDVKVALESARDRKTVAGPIVVTPGGDGMIDVYLNPADLEAGDFDAVVTAADGAVYRVPFTLEMAH